MSDDELRDHMGVGRLPLITLRKRLDELAAATAAVVAARPEPVGRPAVSAQLGSSRLKAVRTGCVCMLPVCLSSSIVSLLSMFVACAPSLLCLQVNVTSAPDAAGTPMERLVNRLGADLASAPTAAAACVALESAVTVGARAGSHNAFQSIAVCHVFTCMSALWLCRKSHAHRRYVHFGYQ